MLELHTYVAYKIGSQRSGGYSTDLIYRKTVGAKSLNSVTNSDVAGSNGVKFELKMKNARNDTGKKAIPYNNLYFNLNLHSPHR